MSTRRQRPESELQRTLVQHLEARAVPGLVWFHVPQGNKLGGKTSAKGFAIQGAKKCSPPSNPISRDTGHASVGWISDGITRSRRSNWSGTEIQTPSTSRNAIASARQPP